MQTLFQSETWEANEGKIVHAHNNDEVDLLHFYHASKSSCGSLRLRWYKSDDEDGWLCWWFLIKQLIKLMDGDKNYENDDSDRWWLMMMVIMMRVMDDGWQR